MAGDIGWTNGWNVFNTTTATTQNLVTYGSNISASPTMLSSPIFSAALQPVLDRELPEDPMAWLHRRVKQIADAGYLS